MWCLEASGGPHDSLPDQGSDDVRQDGEDDFYEQGRPLDLLDPSGASFTESIRMACRAIVATRTKD